MAHCCLDTALAGYGKGGFYWAFGASYNKNFTYADIFNGYLNPHY
jgi:hypothetical protein